MADRQPKGHGIQPPPTRTERGHPLPRRVAPENSVTLQHHRLARDASSAVEADVGAPSRRHSSGESNETPSSDPKNWFDKSNRNPTATFDDPNNMDVDPPFYQQETDSSNELELPPRVPSHAYGQSLAGRPYLGPAVTRHSSSADDYRSVIDDLTIENKRLKEELKRYKQLGPDMMKKEKLFEIKVHGLPNRKKRELEATLRDFAASLEGSSESTSQGPTKPGRHPKHSYASRDGMSKHASSSSTNSRPVDSAYASMSTGPSTVAPQSSTGLSHHGRSTTSLSRGMATSKQKVESYLLDTPEGLLPRGLSLTEKEKKKLVVRRLEQLFTGKTSALLPIRNPEPVREARIELSDALGKKSRSRDNVSASNSEDQTESGGAQGAGDGRGSGSGSANNQSPPTVVPPEQRPTRPRDLDPDRAQTPSENIDYIRHLGIVQPGFAIDNKTLRHDVAADADGWVYLNLLCNLAQLHMINVTPAFIRSAVSEKSTKFQLSPDGRKIRWRGGTDGTKFSSDDSVDNSPKSAAADDASDGSTKTGQRKKAKTAGSGQAMSRNGSRKASKSGLGQVSVSSNSFHYKPLFVRHQSSSLQTTSSDESASQASLGVLVDRSPIKAQWETGGSGSAQRKKRRRDGAIIYYSGAPFCLDLSGDPGDISPTTYMTSTGRERDLDLRAFRPIPHRSWSGSSLLVRPLSDDREIVAEAMDMDFDSPPELLTDDADSAIDLDFEFPWCDEPTSVAPISFPLEPALEPCGLGGVMPEDHFAVICHTRHPVAKDQARRPSRGSRARSEEGLEVIAGRLANMSTSSPAPPPPPSSSSRKNAAAGAVEMTYLSGKLRRLQPVALPPPAMFISPFGTDSDSEGGYDEELDSEDADEESEAVEVEDSSESLMSKLGNPRLSDDNNTYPEAEAEDMSSSNSNNKNHRGDGNSADHDDENMVIADIAGSGSEQEQEQAGRKVSASLHRPGSSGATAGDGQESGYSSVMEEDVPTQ